MFRNIEERNDMSQAVLCIKICILGAAFHRSYYTFSTNRSVHVYNFQNVELSAKQLRNAFLRYFTLEVQKEQ